MSDTTYGLNPKIDTFLFAFFLNGGKGRYSCFVRLLFFRCHVGTQGQNATKVFL